MVRTHFMQTIISSEPFIKRLPPPTAPLSSFFPYLLFLLPCACTPAVHLTIMSDLHSPLFSSTCVRRSLLVAWPWGANKSSLSRPRTRELVEAEERASGAAAEGRGWVGAPSSVMGMCPAASCEVRNLLGLVYAGRRIEK